MVKIEEQIPQKTQLIQTNWLHQSSLSPHQKSTSLKLRSKLKIYVIILPKILLQRSNLRFDSGTPEEWIIFAVLVQKSLVGQNVTIGPPIYKWMEMVLKGDVKAEFTQQVNLVGSCAVANFTKTMTIHVFPTYTYCDQRRYIQRYLRKPPDMKVRTFTTRLI